MADIPEYPSSRAESYLAKLAGQDVELPEPVSRIDQYLLYLIENGGGGGGSGTTNYNNLLNKPKINGVTLTGYKTLSDLGLMYTEDITTASSTWSIQHNLNTDWRELTINIIDADNNMHYVIPDSTSTNNLLVVKFDKAISGKIIIRK